MFKFPFCLGTHGRRTLSLLSLSIPFVFLSMVTMLCFNENFFSLFFFSKLQLRYIIAKYYITRMWANLGGVPGPAQKKKKKKENLSV